MKVDYSLHVFEPSREPSLTPQSFDLEIGVDPYFTGSHRTLRLSGSPKLLNKEARSWRVRSKRLLDAVLPECLQKSISQIKPRFNKHEERQKVLDLPG